jgi:RNA polymerase sigma-70 factor (ECF subfamily)
VNDGNRFRSLIEPHLEKLYRLAFRLTANAADAEDLTQETCLRACEHLDRLADADAGLRWLARIQYNLFIDQTRRRNRSPVRNESDMGTTVDSGREQGNTPEIDAHRDEMQALIQRAWMELDQDERALLSLRAQGFTQKEIEEITKLSAGAVNSRLHRARQKLGGRLASLFGDGDVFSALECEL